MSLGLGRRAGWTARAPTWTALPGRAALQRVSQCYFLGQRLVQLLSTALLLGGNLRLTLEPSTGITNGASSNLLNVQLHNHAGEEIVITRVYGAFREPHGRERALKNVSLGLAQGAIAECAADALWYCRLQR